MSRYTSGEYLWKNPDWHAGDASSKARDIERILQRNGIRFQSLVDVGCGTGNIIQELATTYPNARYVGFDVSPQAIELARRCERQNVTFVEGEISRAGDHGRYDVLLLIDVLEHVDDYLTFLRSLRPRASFHVFHVPLDMNIQGIVGNKQILFRDEIGHLHYFSKATALRTLEDVGYRVIDWFYTGLEASSHPGLKIRAANLVRRALYPLAPDFAVKLLMGYSIMVLAENP